MSVVAVSDFFHAPFSATIDSVAQYFETNPSIRVSPMAAADVGVDVRNTVVDDHTDTVRLHDALHLHWLAPSPFFPGLTALLTVRPHAPGTTVLLTGNYIPPFGWVGGVFDFIFGKFVAALTLRRLLMHLRRHVELQFPKH